MSFRAPARNLLTVIFLGGGNEIPTAGRNTAVSTVWTCTRSRKLTRPLFEFQPEVTSQLIRTIQEALINIRKHVQVNQATIRLGQEDGAIRIIIEDQGQGFDPAKSKEKTSSFGLEMMRERVESVGGHLEVDTASGQGTRITLRYQK